MGIFKVKNILLDKVFLMIGIHIVGVIGFYDAIQYAQYRTIAWFALINILSMFGLAVGVHRLWSHKAFKVNIQEKLHKNFHQTSEILFKI